jgi:hypothetical protein
MADKLIINSNIGIGKLPESALSVIDDLAADFAGARTSALNVTIPNISKILNTGLIGDGHEWASQSDPDYAEHTAMTFSDRLNTGQFALLLARFLSGTITSTQVGTTGVYDHVVQMKASDLDPQLKSTSVCFELGGFDFILGGMCGNNLNVAIQGGSAPTYQAEMVGTGYFEYMASQTPSLVIPDPIAENYVGQRSQATFEFNDGTVFDVAGAGRLESLNMQFTNNLITGERRIGDALVDPTDANSGAFVQQLTRGDQRNLTITAGIYVGTDKRGYLAHLANTTITNLKFKCIGNKVIGSSGTQYHEIEFTIPLAVITSAALGGDRKGIITLTFQPLFNSAGSETGVFKARVRNLLTTIA